MKIMIAWLDIKWQIQNLNSINIENRACKKKTMGECSLSFIFPLQFANGRKYY